MPAPCSGGSSAAAVLCSTAGLHGADRFRFASELRAWIEVNDAGQPGARPTVVHWLLFTVDDARTPASACCWPRRRDREPVRRLELKTPGLGMCGKLSDARNG
jgi:hypothetical protein